MKRLLGGWGRRLALVAVVAAVTVPAGPARAGGDALADPAGDATAVGWQCILDCPSAPAPVSEPAIDLLSVGMVRSGNDLVFETTVLDLDHVPPASMPDDTLGWNVFFDHDDRRIGVAIVAQRSASHAPQQSFVIVNNWTDPNQPVEARRDVAVSYDADDTVRVRLSLSDLNELIDEVCSDCAHVSNGTVFTSPHALTYVLATTPLGPTGPTHGDRPFSPVDPGWVVD